MVTPFKNIRFTVQQWLTLFLLVLAGMNVFSMYYYFLLAAAAFFLITQKRYIFDINVLFLLVLSISWMLFSPETASLSITSLIKPTLYPLAYMVGRNFFDYGQIRDVNFAKNAFIPAITLLSLGPFLHYLLNYLLNLSSGDRNTIDFWSRSILSATGQAALACMMLAVAIALLFMSVKRTTKMCAVGVLLIIFLYNFILSGRTLFVIAICVVLGCLLYYLYTNKSREKRAKIIIIILCVAFLLTIILSLDLFGVRSFIEQSNLYKRFTEGEEELGETGRWERKAGYLENFSQGMLGGAKLREIIDGYAHDLFLDTYDEAGFFALLAVFFFCVKALLLCIKFLGKKDIAFDGRIMIVALYIAIYMQFCVEPILQGMAWLFALFCFVVGMLEKIMATPLPKRMRDTET